MEIGEASAMEISGESVWWSWRSMVVGYGYGGLHGGWASMASGRDQRWLTRSAEAGQQWPISGEIDYGAYLAVDGVNLQCDADNIQLFLAEVKLAWIVRIVAAILKTLQISGQWRIARSI
nr:hypothetical protein CFP56_25182 [Quercus suber]